MKRSDIIKRLEENFACPVKVRITEVSHADNPLAPEKVCYRIHFTQFGVRRKTTLWPNTVGFQC